MKKLPYGAVNRLRHLKEEVEELRVASFGQQYGLADFAEEDAKVKEKLDALSKETEAYKNILDRIEGLIGSDREEDDGMPF